VQITYDATFPGSAREDVGVMQRTSGLAAGAVVRKRRCEGCDKFPWRP
jgi:hypothetical protein